MASAAQLASAVLQGSRLALSRALSLCESRLPAHRAQGVEVALLLRRAQQQELQQQQQQHDMQQQQQQVNQFTSRLSVAWRLGFTGPPGAGKSSLIDALGSRLLQRGLRVCCLCVDPSSAVTGGSVLGDRTRMSSLVSAGCFVRGSAAGCDEGGLNSAARLQIQLLEALHDVVLVETVGVGQTEHEVEAIVDTMLLVLPPASGDSLQGMKRGITELADIVVVNKCDGPLTDSANRAALDYRASMRLLGLRKDELWKPPVLRASAHSGMGLDAVISTVEKHRAQLGDIVTRRHRKEWGLLWTLCSRQVLSALRDDERVLHMMPLLEEKVARGETTIDEAASQIIRTKIGNLV